MYVNRKKQSVLLNIAANNPLVMLGEYIPLNVHTVLHYSHWS